MKLVRIKKVVLKLLLGLLGAIILFHLLILVKIIPYQITWGGRLKNDNEMYVFESVSIFINLILITSLLLKAKIIKSQISIKLINGVLWSFIVVFLLNTLGNIFAKTSLEKSFSILTLLFSIGIFVILLKDKTQTEQSEGHA